MLKAIFSPVREIEFTRQVYCEQTLTIGLSLIQRKKASCQKNNSPPHTQKKKTLAAPKTSTPLQPARS
jgi:hypothetical protein